MKVTQPFFIKSFLWVPVLLPLALTVDSLSLKADSTPKINSFVSRQGTDFVVDGRVFRFAGTNGYYLPTYEKINPKVVDKAFDAFKKAGITVVRMWGFYDGFPQYESDITLQPLPGKYNEEDLRHLDAVISKAKRHGIRVILTLSNYWKELGGMPQYNKWDGNPGGGMQHFIKDPDTQRWFKNYISMVTNRINSVTGISYKNEPAIFSWEIMGEARLPGGDPAVLRDWYREIAQHIKKEDPNHLVATGEEGFEIGSPKDYSMKAYSNPYILQANMGTSYKMNTAIPEIDYGTAHWYPSLYGFDNYSYREILTAQSAWIRDHVKIAETQNKPFVLGEYGYDGWGDQKQLAIYQELWEYAKKIKLDGSLIWQYTAGNTKCYESGGNICWPGGRRDDTLYNLFFHHIQAMNSLK